MCHVKEEALNLRIRVIVIKIYCTPPRTLTDECGGSSGEISSRGKPDNT
jgi:hypothetical protein